MNSVVSNAWNRFPAKPKATLLSSRAKAKPTMYAPILIQSVVFLTNEFRWQYFEKFKYNFRRLINVLNTNTNKFIQIYTFILNLKNIYNLQLTLHTFKYHNK